MNSNNQEFKEATFSQMGRRGGEVEIGGEAWRSRVVHRGMEMGTGGPTSTCSRQKNGRETLGVRDPSPSPNHPAQGPGMRKISAHDFWL